MDFVFDLQLFADEEEAAVEVETEEQETTEPSEEPEEPKEEPKEEMEIPEELDGLDLSQDEVKEILKEVAPKEEQKEEPKPDADADSDNKQVPTEDNKPQQNIPYARFKEVLDKQHAADEEIAKLKDQLAKAQAAPPPPPPKAPAPQAEMPSFSPEIAKQIDAEVTKQAMQMTGMTKEDIDALDYADDDDAKAKTYRYAKDLARATIIENIQRAARRQQEYTARILENHQKLVNEYNQFYNEQKAQPDFNEVVNFATNEFFEQQAPGVQFAVSDAYTRVQRNTASPQDILVVKNFFAEAQNAYRVKEAPKAAAPTVTNNKPNLPKVQEVRGSATSPKETITVASLTKMLEENKLETLPEKYQKTLLGM